MGAQFSQFFPPKPTFAPESVETQDGRVFLITGGYSGIGYELAKMLYEKMGRVYIAGRSQDKAQKAIRDIQAAVPVGGSLHFLHLQLDDLSTIRSCVDEFKSRETQLHVLWNNAGVSQPPVGSVSKQGIELQLATNCLGRYLLTQSLLPVLEATSANPTNPPGSVRVVWSSSQVTELSAPPQGIIMAEVQNPPKSTTRNYTNSKTGNMFLASQLAKIIGQSHQIVSISQNPGACNTPLFRHTPSLPYLAWPLLHKPRLGAITSLYSGLSNEITLNDIGSYVVPWGRMATSVRDDLVEAMRSTDDGGSGRAEEFWDFCEERTRDYM